MARNRTDNVFGTLTDDPLTSGATTMNSAGLANLAVISGSEGIITLDPNRVAGAPEIVVVTAHSSSATSATIQRGQFGTTAREHAQGTEWVHGPIAGNNAVVYSDPSDDQGDFVPLNEWQLWTPTLTNLTPGSGATNNAYFVRIGRTIHFRWSVVLGTSPSVGDVRFTLPVQPHSHYVDAKSVIGWGSFHDANGSAFPGAVRMEQQSTSSARLIVHNAASTYVQQAATSSTVPFTWVATDSFFFSGTYEAAS